MTIENENGGNENNNENMTPATPSEPTTTPAAEPAAPEAVPAETSAEETPATPTEEVPTTEATSEVPPADPRTVKVTFTGASTQTVEVAAGSKLAEAIAKANLTAGGFSYRISDKAAYGTHAVTEDVSVNVVAKSRAA